MDKKGREKASHLRQEIVRVQGEMATHLESILRRRALLRGSLYEWKRKCGARNCRCKRGDLHSSWMLSYREGGKVRKVTVAEEALASYQAAAQAQRAFRSDREGVLKGQAKIRELMRELEEELLVDPPKGRSGIR